MSDETSCMRFACPDCHGIIEMPVPTSPPDEIPCPHCGYVIRQPEQSSKPSAKKTTLLIIVLLCMCAVGALVAIWLKQATTPRAQPGAVEPAAFSISTNGFRIFGMRVETQGSLRYALGITSNELAQERFGVRIQLELLDTNGWRVGTTSDYRSVLHSNEVWHFRALVVEPAAASASLTSVREEQ